ncbi:MAG: hypothetical protein J0L72_08635 [Armatimonadetes bacterium]|nr:hypothetical protein [Armatimonadota bacterium]
MTHNPGTSYLVHMPDGSELGPASLDDLCVWVEAGVVSKTTALSIVGSEVRVPAVSIQGLFGPTSAPAPVQPSRPLSPSQSVTPIIKGSGRNIFTSSKSDVVVGWIGVLLSVLVFFGLILVVALGGNTMSAGDMVGAVLTWLVNFVMATAFIGLIRSRPWAFSVGLVAGCLGTVTNFIGRALETPSKSEGGLDTGFTVLVWLVPIAFAIYCWRRQNSLRQVGRV